MENKKVLVDTTLLIEYYRKGKKEETQLYSIINLDLYISVITLFEFRIGKNLNNEFFINEILEYVKLLPMNDKCVDAAVQIHNILKRNNKLIEITDLFIAATALAYKIPLATLNKKHFDRIPDLKLY